MTDRELLDRKGHEVNDDLPPLPEPAFRLLWKHGEYRVTKPNIGDTDVYTADQYRAAVLAERERCAKECDKIGERHRKMNDSRPPELMTSGENAAYECADAIRKDAP